MTELTAWDIQELRYWAASSGFIRDGEPDRGYPFVTYGRPGPETEGIYYLHSQGVTVACSSKDSVILACLRNERHEAGFMRRVLSTEVHAQEALLTPEERAAALRKRQTAEAYARLNAEAAREKAKREAAIRTQKPVASLTLDDLEAL